MGLAPTNYADHNDSAAVHLLVVSRVYYILLVVLYACHWTTTVLQHRQFTNIGPKELLIQN